MDGLLLQVASGLVSGALYGGFALALVMVHRSTGHINFAQGEIATLGTFTVSALAQAGIPLLVASALALVGSFLFGALIETVLIRRLGERSALSLIMVTIGLFMLLNGSSGFLFGYSPVPVESPFSNLPISTTYLSAHEIGSLVTIGLIVLALFCVFRFTSFGLAMRGAALNPASARLVGINVELVRAAAWGIAAAIGTVVGLLIAPVVFLEPNMMIGILVYGFAAALVGGIDNPFGAVAGGVLVGLTENLAGAYVVGTELKLTVALAVIVAVLLVRPAGLFGTAVVRRV